MDGRGNRTEKRGEKKTPNGHTSGADAGGGVCVARLYPIPPPLFSTSYSSLHDGARPVSSSSPVAITPTHLTGSSLPFHSSKLGPNVTPLLPSHTRFFLLLYPLKSNQSKSFSRNFSDFFPLFFFLVFTLIVFFIWPVSLLQN
jgi:hypothetical protein